MSDVRGIYRSSIAKMKPVGRIEADANLLASNIAKRLALPSRRAQKSVVFVRDAHVYAPVLDVRTDGLCATSDIIGVYTRSAAPDLIREDIEAWRMAEPWEAA